MSFIFLNQVLRVFHLVKHTSPLRRYGCTRVRAGWMGMTVKCPWVDRVFRVINNPFCHNTMSVFLTICSFPALYRTGIRFIIIIFLKLKLTLQINDTHSDANVNDSWCKQRQWFNLTIEMVSNQNHTQHWATWLQLKFGTWLLTGQIQPHKNSKCHHHHHHHFLWQVLTPQKMFYDYLHISLQKIQLKMVKSWGMEN